MTSPIAGLKILDLSQIMAGPYCTMTLADMGAEVIKVEKPNGGDDSRQMGPFVHGESTCFAQLNRNKLGISLNLKDQNALDILYKLVEWADVVVENYRVGVAKRLGVDYESLKKIKPDIIYCSISGYGQTGPYSQKGGFDLVAQGMSSIMSMTGDPGGRPVKVGVAIYDVGAGITAAYSILAAYIHRLKTGEGQSIDLSLAEVGLPWFAWEAAAYFSEGTLPAPTGNRHRFDAPYQAFKTKDKFIIIGAANQRNWERLCTDVLNRPDLITDERFIDNHTRVANVDLLEKTLEEIFVQRTASDWIARCDQAGVPCGPINDFAAAASDPHYIARNMIQEIDHPVIGPMKTFNLPPQFSRMGHPAHRPAPLLGEHTAEVLARFGVSPEEQAALQQQGAVYCSALPPHD